MEPDGSTPNDGSNQPVTWWVRLRKIPPTMALVIKDRFGALHTWRLRFIDEWKTAHKKYWSLWVAFFWASIGMIVMIMGLLSDTLVNWIGPVWFGVILFISGVSYVMARYLKQPGTEGTDQ